MVKHLLAKEKIRVRGVGGSNPSSPTAFQRGKDLYFLPEGRKIMIGIADVKLLNLGMLFPFVEVES